MKAAQLILLSYSLILSIILVVGSFLFGIQSKNFLLPVFSLPLIIYFSFTILKIKKRRKTLLYYCFFLVTIMTIAGFIGASTPPQFASAVLFLPITVYFWFQVLPKRGKKEKIQEGLLSIIPGTEIPLNDNKVHKLKKVDIKKEYPEEKYGKSFDLDRRMFLKLIGSAGISVFMLAIFTKKAQGAFFGSVPGPGTVAIKDSTGAQIDPAIKQPTDGYSISQIDDSSPAYYGFVDKNGNWYIMKEDSSNNYRYTKGSSGFSTNWTNRTSLSYDYFDAVF